MEMDDVERCAVENSSNGRPLEERSARLMRHERRQPSQPAPQWMNLHSRVVGPLDVGRPLVQDVVRIDAVNHVHFVARVGERVGEAVHVRTIAAKAVWRVKRRDVEESL
jgi:hypothetical protein